MLDIDYIDGIRSTYLWSWIIISIVIYLLSFIIIIVKIFKLLYFLDFSGNICYFILFISLLGMIICGLIILQDRKIQIYTDPILVLFLIIFCFDIVVVGAITSYVCCWQDC